MVRKALLLTLALFVVGGLIALGLDLIQRSPIKPALAHDYSSTWEIKWTVGGQEWAENAEIPITLGTETQFEVKVYKDGSNVTSNFYFAHSMLGYITTQTGHYLKVKVDEAGRGEKGWVYLLTQPPPPTTEMTRITTYAYYAAEDRFINANVYFKES